MGPPTRVEGCFRAGIVSFGSEIHRSHGSHIVVESCSNAEFAVNPVTTAIAIRVPPRAPAVTQRESAPPRPHLHWEEIAVSDGTGLAEQIAARRRALTIRDLAELLGVSPTTIYDQARDGRLPAIRIGSAIRIDPKAAAEWVRRHGG